MTEIRPLELTEKPLEAMRSGQSGKVVLDWGKR